MDGRTHEIGGKKIFITLRCYSAMIVPRLEILILEISFSSPFFRETINNLKYIYDQWDTCGEEIQEKSF